MKSNDSGLKFSEDELRGLDQAIGSSHHRAYVGPPARYDLVAAMQFCLLVRLGLREDHYLLDIGCGSLRGGKLFLSYLLPGRYHGVEPEQWLVEKGIRYEIGPELIDMKRPRIINNTEFDFLSFENPFDFVLAQSIFTHAGPTDIRKCLQNSAKVLADGAVFAANFIEGTPDNQKETWSYPGCVVYGRTWMADVIHNAGLHVGFLPISAINGCTWAIIGGPEVEEKAKSFSREEPAFY